MRHHPLVQYPSNKAVYVSLQAVAHSPDAIVLQPPRGLGEVEQVRVPLYAVPALVLKNAQVLHGVLLAVEQRVGEALQGRPVRDEPSRHQ